jgi:hypothetical protein
MFNSLLINKNMKENKKIELKNTQKAEHFVFECDAPL